MLEFLAWNLFLADLRRMRKMNFKTLPLERHNPKWLPVQDWSLLLGPCDLQTYGPTSQIGGLWGHYLARSTSCQESRDASETHEMRSFILLTQPGYSTHRTPPNRQQSCKDMPSAPDSYVWTGIVHSTAHGTSNTSSTQQPLQDRHDLV